MINGRTKVKKVKPLYRGEDLEGAGRGYGVTCGPSESLKTAHRFSPCLRRREEGERGENWERFSEMSELADQLC